MYKEIIVETTGEGADFVADAFFSLGATGVKIIDPSDLDDLIKNGKNWDYIDDSLMKNRDEATKVSAFVALESCNEKIEELKKILASYTGIDFGSLKITTADYVDGDWLTEWKKYYKPIEVGAFVIIPEWQTYDNKKGFIEIKIDPSMAFGTGEHESTKLCLTLLSDGDLHGKTVIDVGTGSGILGIAAVKRGAKSVYMCDIDSLSIKNSTENAELNGVLDAVTIEESDLMAKTDRTADVITANLTADILMRLSDGLPKHMNKNAILICSGIIHSRKAEVIKDFTSKGLTLEKEVVMGEWDGLRFRLL